MIDCFYFFVRGDQSQPWSICILCACVYIYMHALRGIIVLSVVVWYQCCPKYWSTSERFYSALCKIRRHFGAALGECTIPGVEVCSKNLQMQDSRRIFCGNHKVDSARFRYSVLHNFILQESNCILANLLTRIFARMDSPQTFIPEYIMLSLSKRNASVTRLCCCIPSCSTIFFSICHGNEKESTNCISRILVIYKIGQQMW